MEHKERRASACGSSEILGCGAIVAITAPCVRPVSSLSLGGRSRGTNYYWASMFLALLLNKAFGNGNICYVFTFHLL